MFTEDVCWVVLTSNVVEAGDASSNCFSRSVIRKSIVTLVELTMRNRGRIDTGLVIPEDNG